MTANRLFAVFSIAILSLTLAGCADSSPSFDSREGAIVETMHKTFATYDEARQGDASSTASACATAAASLAKLKPPPVAQAPKGKRALVRLLRTILMEARNGFEGCASADESDDYVQMVHASRTLDTVNSMLKSARKMDR